MGERGRGRPKKRWMDQVRQDCEEMGFESIQDATWIAQDRECWRTLVNELPIHRHGIKSSKSSTHFTGH